MTPNLQLIEGLHGVMWDADAAEARVERLMQTIKHLPPEIALGLEVLIAQANCVLSQALELLDELLVKLDPREVPVPGPLPSEPRGIAPYGPLAPSGAA